MILSTTRVRAVSNLGPIQYLRPFSEHVRDLPAGWLIPIAILVIISFPPLFGHEIVALLCGVVYGLWIGFGIVAAGTFIGERRWNTMIYLLQHVADHGTVGTWFAFQYLLRRKAEKLERTNLNYGALARLTRDGGFWVSAAPFASGHMHHIRSDANSHDYAQSRSSWLFASRPSPPTSAPPSSPPVASISGSSPSPPS